MSAAVLYGLVILSAIAHATWNAMMKSAGDRLLTMVMIRSVGLVIGLAVLFVFLALAALYESWTLPLAVILVVPLCLLCSVAGVRITNRDVNIFVQIGLVVLVGLACKNAILIVEYAKQLHHEGRSVFDATVEASRLRLRPPCISRSRARSSACNRAPSASIRRRRVSPRACLPRSWNEPDAAHLARAEAPSRPE